MDLKKFFLIKKKKKKRIITGVCVFQSSESWMLWSPEMYEGTGSSANSGSSPRPSPVLTLPTTSDSSSPCLWSDKHKSSSWMTASPRVLIMSGVRPRYPFHWTWPSQLCTVSSGWAEPSSEWSAVSNGNLLWTSRSVTQLCPTLW